MKKKTCLTIGAIGATIMPIATVISCNNFNKKNNHKTEETTQSTSDGQNSKDASKDNSTQPQSKKDIDEVQALITKYHITRTTTDHNGDGKINFALVGHVDDKSELDTQDAGYGNIYVASKDLYNAVLKVIFEAANSPQWDKTATLADAMSINANKVMGDKAIANIFITSKEFHIEFFAGKDNQKVIDYMRDSDQSQVEEVNVAKMGIWMARVRFFEKGEDSSWEHGDSHHSNYGILGYPLYYINHTNFAQLGVSNQPSSPHQIYEISYDHDA